MKRMRALMVGLTVAPTRHGSIETLRRMAPHTTVHTDRRFVDNGKIVTAAGGGVGGGGEVSGGGG